MSKQANSLNKWVKALEGTQFTRSAFEEWVDTEFADVKATANAALPCSEFESFLAMEEETRSQTVQGDTVMERAAITGAKRTNDDAEDSGDPAARAKQRHGRIGSPEVRSTPGADTFAAMGQPKTLDKHKGTTARSNSQDKLASHGKPAKGAATAGDEPWLQMGPTPKSAWSDQAMDLLQAEWTDTCNFRLSRSATVGWKWPPQLWQ